MWMLLVVGCYLGLLRLAGILEYPSCRLCCRSKLMYWDFAPVFAGAWRQRCAGKDLDIVAVSADTPLLIGCRDKRVPGCAWSSCIIFPDCRQISS